MKNVILYLCVGAMIIGCAGYGAMDKGAILSASGLSKQTFKSNRVTYDGLIAENFPTVRVHLGISFEYDVLTKEEKECWANGLWPDEKVTHVVLLNLADRKLEDFHGSKNLQATLEWIRKDLNAKVWPGRKNGDMITQIYLQDLKVITHSNRTAVPPQ